MTTYSIRELRAKAGQILDSLAEGEEVIITRRGKPCARLAPLSGEVEAEQKLPLHSLRDAFRGLPDLSYEEIQAMRDEMNQAWKSRLDDIIDDDAK